MTTYTIQVSTTITANQIDLSSGDEFTNVNTALTAATTGSTGLINGDSVQVSLSGDTSFETIIISSTQFATLPDNVTFAKLWGAFQNNALTISKTF